MEEILGFGEVRFMSVVGELVGSGEGQKRWVVVSSSLGRYIRRTFDIVIATIGIGLFAPVFLTAIAIKLEFPARSIRKSLFGYGGRLVGAYKFRFVTYRAGSPGLTRVGRLINHTGIEGLPSSSMCYSAKCRSSDRGCMSTA